MEESIAQFLAFARPFELTPAATDAESIVARAVALNETRAREHSIELDSAIGDGIPALFVDTLRVAEALGNIIDNAVDAIGKDGHVYVHVTSNGQHVFFDVLDDGPGIELDERDDLLSPFLTKKHDGTGLGLSIVNRIITAHDGQIEYGNREEGGAWFRVTLPIRPSGR